MSQKKKQKKFLKLPLLSKVVWIWKMGQDISENLNWLYRYIRYMSKRIQDNECMNFVQPALKLQFRSKRSMGFNS